MFPGLHDSDVSAARHHSLRGHIYICVSSLLLLKFFIGYKFTNNEKNVVSVVELFVTISVSHRDPVKLFVRKNPGVYWAS